MKDKSQAEIEKTTSKSLKSQGDVFLDIRGLVHHQFF